MTTLKQLKRLKAKLPQGYRETLSVDTGLSIATIDKVFAGERVNLSVIKAALGLAQKHQQEISELKSELKSL